MYRVLCSIRQSWLKNTPKAGVFNATINIVYRLESKKARKSSLLLSQAVLLSIKKYL